MAPTVTIPPPDTPLTKYTVPQLKAKCQQLGIQGVSKFNKARLVQTILDATATHPQSQAPAQTAQTAQTAPVPPSENVAASHQVVATGATGSHSTPRDRGSTSITASSNDLTLAPSVVTKSARSSVLVATSATQPITDETANPASTSAPRGVPDAGVATPSSAAAPTTKRKRSSTKTATTKRTKRTLMQDTSQPASSGPKTSSTVPKPSPAPISQPPSSQHSALHSLRSLPNSMPTPSSTSQKIPTQQSALQSRSTDPATSTRTDLHALSRPQPLKHVSTETATPRNNVSVADVSKLPAASRLPSSKSAAASASRKAILPSSTTRTRTTVVPKRVPKANASINGKPIIKRPAFTPLKASTAQPKPLAKPRPQHSLRFPLTPLISDASLPDGTIENRVAHINSHFLNRLFLNLNAARSWPVLAPPFPTPVAYPPDYRSDLAFQGFHPQVFGCPNNAFKVATRFWIARAHTMLMLGSGMEWSAEAGGMGLLGPDMSKWPPVTTCSKVIDGIFEITTEEVTDDSPPQIISAGKGKKTKAKSKALDPRTNSTTTTAFLVLATTGDVIATSRPPTTDTSKQSPLPLIRGCDVRQDWHAFITGRSHTQSTLDISSLVRTKDTNSFPSGISKSWTTRLPDAKTSEEFKVAQRAVLTSCALNSFSGEKLDAVQMDAEFLNNWVPLERGQKSKIELYLPESQQVVSVHLAPPPAHPALAIVHRASGKSDYVLRETGHVVGNEDGGIVELWQGILGCDHKGMEVADVSGFWQGWEDRVRGSSDADF